MTFAWYDPPMMRPAALAACALLLCVPAARAQDASPDDDDPATVVPAEPVPDAAPDANAKPSPDLSPQEVVATVLSALAHNDRPNPDTGIKITFRFASPANREMTGPIDHFIGLVKNPQYGVLIGHTKAERSDLRITGDVAEQLVKVTAADGAQAVFVFRLGKQPDGAFKGCWMTDGVIRLDPPNAPPPVPGEMI